ncbi:MAG: hypothetical protein Q7U09_07800 [Hydrogenophaga sp.]|nr:hypothetical protein [Hydrogenophaga sp.]
MTTNRVPEVENTLRATGAVLGLLPQVAGFAVGFTGLAYIAGWRETSAFYRELGAPWAAALVTSAQIMQASIWLIFLIFMFAFISVLAIIEKNVGQKGLRLWSIFLLGVAGIFLISSLALEGRVSASTTNALLVVAAIFWAISAGTTIGELIACLALQQFKWGGYEVFLLYFVLIYGLSQAPTIMGESRARLAAESASMSLPGVTLIGSALGSWRLVGVCGDKLLLVSLAADRQKRLFKLVAAESILEIRVPGIE